MKKIQISALLLFFIFVANAQEQIGFVKAIGRPGQPGKPIENVMVRAQGAVNASLSDSSGYFSLALNHYELGQAYTLSRVSRTGYRLVDEDVIGRQYPYSDEVPLEISMVSNDVYNKTKSEIESKVRVRIEEEYQRKYNELLQQLEARTISEEKHIKELCKLNNYYDKSENLISKLADRYAKMDYDRLDSLDMLINSYIEQGELEEAEALIESKGTRQALEQLEKENLMLEHSLAEGKKAETKMREEYATELMARYEIALLRFDNVAAANLLKERMELDTTRVDWRMNYAIFIDKYLGKYEEALALFTDILSSYKHPSVYNCMGTVYYQLGDYENSLNAFKTSIELRTSSQQPTRELAQSYNNIANIYISKDEYDSALDCLEKSRLIYEELEDSLGIASVNKIKADYYVDMGLFDDALSCLKQTIEIRLSKYGEVSKEVANAYYHLAQVLRKCDINTEASEYANKANEIFIKILGDRHPIVASTYQLIGSLAMDVGDYDKALLFYQKSEDIYTVFFHGIHPDIVTIYNKLAYYYSEAEHNYEKAISYHTKSKDMAAEIYGKNHGNVAIAWNNIGQCYGEIRHYEEAYNCYMEALQISQNLYGTSHFTIAEIYNNLAGLYSDQDKFEEAAKMQKQALSIFVEVYGEKHRAVAIAYNNLGSIYNDIKDYDKAVTCYKKAESIGVEVLGDNHIFLATIYGNLSIIYSLQKKYDEAELLANKALECRLMTLGEDHPDTALSYINLATLYSDLGKWNKAEEYFKHALDVMLRIYGEKSPYVVTIYGNLSSMYDRMQQYEQSIEYANKAINLSKELYGWNHMETVALRYALAVCYNKLHQYDEAIACFSALYYYFLNAKGSENIYTQLFFRELHKSYNAVISTANYDGRYKVDYDALIRNSIVIARVENNSTASLMGLNGDYYVIEYEEWSVDQEDYNFFSFMQTVQSRKQKTYVLYRDGEFVVVPFEDKLGVGLGYQWIPAEEKRELIKKYHKWNKRR